MAGMPNTSVSDRLGYANLAESTQPKLGGGSPMLGGAKSVGAPIQLAPSETIGIQPAQSSAPQQKSGGSGGIIGRGLSFLKGIGEGRPGGDLPEAAGGAAASDAAAGGAEAAGGDLLAEAAPLLLAAV